MRARALLLAPAVLAAAVAGCGRSQPNPARPAEPAAAGDTPNVDVGAPLYPAKPDVKVPVPTTTGREPLVVPNCTVQYEERQQVSAEVDGTIELIGVLDPTLPAGHPNLVYHPRDKARAVKYRRLREGDPVKDGDVICMLNDQQVAVRKNGAMLTKKAAEGIQKSAKQGVELSEQKLKVAKEAYDKGTGSFVEFLQDHITLTRFEENLGQALQTIAKADAEYEEADQLIRRHQVKSTVNGLVRGLAKRPGEFVKAGEKILEIQATDRVRLEGFLDVQYAGLVRRGQIVTVEPAVPSAPTKTLPLHRQAVTGLAVSSHPDRPVVVSVSADGTGRAWDVTAENGAAHGLAHPVPVRAVACSPAGVKPVAVTGAEDGKLRVFDLTNPDRIDQTGQELADAHTATVGAIAFSPDGKFLASAAGREVMIWDATAWKKLYTLPAEHRDAVTSVQFTPQGTLVTAAKDRSLKVWRLGAEKGAAARTLDHRGGTVDVLGVTSDGGRVVFDHNKSRLDLVALADRQTVGQVQNVGPTSAFATLAVFSRDDSFLVTAGGEGELKGGLQVWRVPQSGGRGSEEARLFTPGRAGVTAAAFSPTEKHRFLAVGTDLGTVHLWTPPVARKAYTGEVVYVDASDARQVTVRVEMDNRELGLLDRSAATVIITPGQ
jgi:WD40 repeat protein/biotin carboxyl carrier protein